MTAKNFDDDNDGCNDNYDGRDGNFDDNGEETRKTEKEHIQLFRDYYLVKKGQQILSNVLFPLMSSLPTMWMMENNLHVQYDLAILPRSMKCILQVDHSSNNNQGY